ncbi:MAG: DUF4358 domain-containing protein [Ruminiclostridium sp.]|nr:DUF4358 domain-containing protein [Ruminiclostridium sp.]
MKIRTIISALLIPAMLLTGCSKTEQGGNTDTRQEQTEGNPAVSVSASEVVKAVLAEISINSSVEKGKDDIENYYSSLDTATVEDAAFALCGSGALPDEIAVIKCKSAEDAKNAETALKSKLEKQKELFSTYTPDEMYKLEGAVIFTKGNYAVFIALSDNDKAKSIVEGKLS